VLQAHLGLSIAKLQDDVGVSTDALDATVNGFNYSSVGGRGVPLVHPTSSATPVFTAAGSLNEDFHG